MSDPARVWTEVEWEVLAPGERAETTPSDTRSTPYVARTRGLASGPQPDQDGEVETLTGRRVRGRVTEVLPGYHHTFGNPLPEWIEMRESIRRLAVEMSGEDTTEGGQR